MPFGVQCPAHAGSRPQGWIGLLLSTPIASTEPSIPAGAGELQNYRGNTAPGSTKRVTCHRGNVILARLVEAHGAGSTVVIAVLVAGRLPALAVSAR